MHKVKKKREGTAKISYFQSKCLQKILLHFQSDTSPEKNYLVLVIYHVCVNFHLIFFLIVKKRIYFFITEKKNLVPLADSSTFYMKTCEQVKMCQNR